MIWKVCWKKGRLRQLYFAQNLETDPEYDFAAVGHNLMVALEQKQIIILAPAVPEEGKFYQLLEAPLTSISRMSISRYTLEIHQSVNLR